MVVDTSGTRHKCCANGRLSSVSGNFDKELMMKHKLQQFPLFVIDNLKYAEFFKKYNTSSMRPKYHDNNPNAENDVSLDRHYFKDHMDPDQEI